MQLVIGGYSQSMAEQMRQVSNVQLVNGIDGLLKADAPAAYQGWTVDQTPVIVAGAFFIPAGLVLLGLALRLVIPRAAAEKMKTSLHAYAAELRRRRGR